MDVQPETEDVQPETEYFVLDVGWQYPVGLSVSQAVEVISLTPEQICPLPTGYTAVLGVVGWRGQLIWTIALDTWLGLESHNLSAAKLGSRPVVVLQEHTLGRKLACVAHRLGGIEVIAPDSLNALPEKIPPSLAPYFSGQVPNSQLLVLKNQCLFQPETWRIPHDHYAI